MKKVIYLILVILVSISCDSTEPENEKRADFKLTDSGCIEASFEVSVTNINYPAKFSIYQEDSLYYSNIINTEIDTFIVENLEPKTNYAFYLSFSDDIKSEVVTFTTLDTTSHELTWQNFFIGSGIGNSFLKDVAIINENNIWAVGQISVDEEKYNAVHWNGSEWEPTEIFINNVYYPLNTIFVLDENDILVANLSVIRYKDDKVVYYGSPDNFGRIKSIWANSAEDFYIVGDDGDLRHYNGTEWKKIYTGTDVTLTDMWGDEDGDVIWVCGQEDSKPNVLIKIEDEKANLVFNDFETKNHKSLNYLSGRFYSVWMDNDENLYQLVSHTLFRLGNNFSNPKALWRDLDTKIGILKVRGTDRNDIYTIGTRGIVDHYNGKDWKTYTELAATNIKYYGLSVKNNITVAVGVYRTNGIEDRGIISLTKK